MFALDKERCAQARNFDPAHGYSQFEAAAAAHSGLASVIGFHDLPLAGQIAQVENSDRRHGFRQCIPLR